MATKVNELTDVGNITDADKLVGERVDGTTVRITFNGVLLDGEFSANGLMTRTAAGTYASRTLTGTSNRISVTNGDGVSGNPTIDIDASFVAAVTEGGTGQTSYTNGQLLIGNTTGNTLTKATITGGTNLTVTNGTGTITLDVDDSFLLNTGDVGTGTYDFGGATSFEIPNSATPTVDADGEVAVDTTVTDFSHGVMKYYGGEEMGVVSMPIAEFTSPTDGHVVSYNATNDEFELAAGGGGAADWELVASATPSASATVDFTGLTSTYIAYNVIFTDIIPATDGANFTLQVGTGGTPTWVTSGYSYSIVFGNDAASNGFTESGSASAILLCNSTGSAANELANGKIVAYNPSQSSGYHNISFETAFTNSAAATLYYNGQGTQEASTAVTALRFLMSTGNIASGEIRLYGLKAA